MPFVITLVDYRPSPRYPPITTAWTEARVAYAPVLAGPYVPFDTVALSPLDSDPTAPRLRNLTSVLSPEPTGFFQVTFLDAAGNEEPTDPIAYRPQRFHGPPSGAMLAATQSHLVEASSTQISTVTGVPPTLAGHLTWRLIDDADGSVVIAESPDSIIEIDDGHDAPMRRYDRVYTAPAMAGRYLAIWRNAQEEVAQTVVVASSADAEFASPEDVAARLGRALTSKEADNAPFLLSMAAAVIADAAGYDDGWAVRLNPVPNMLRLLSVELVCRALPNPSQYSSIRQQVGSYSFEAAQAAVGMTLTDAETLMVRRAVHGRTTDSVPVESSFERAQDEYWLRKQSVRFTDPQDPAYVIP